jgi:hypothetical protein
VSSEALRWAKRVRTGSGSTKTVLLLLADVADADGFVRFLSVKYLTDCGELSRSTVFAHLRRLEDGGVAVRLATGRRDNGGELISIQLRLDRAFGETEGVAATAEAEGGAVQLPDSPPVQNTDSPCGQAERGVQQADWGESGVRTASLNTGILNPKQDSSLSSSEPETAGARDDEQRGGGTEGLGGQETAAAKRDEQFKLLLQRYPVRSWMSVNAARREFFELTAKQREKALRFAPVYAAGVKEGGRRSVMDAAQWLRDCEFDGLALIAKAQPENPAVAPQAWVRRGTKAWTAWTAVWRRQKGFARGEPFFSHNPELGCDGAWRPTLFPPGVAAPQPSPAEASTGPPEDEAFVA